MIKLYWKRDISLFKKRRKAAVYRNSSFTHFDYDFYGVSVRGIHLGIFIKTGESNPK